MIVIDKKSIFIADTEYEIIIPKNENNYVATALFNNIIVKSHSMPEHIQNDLTPIS